MAKDPQPRALKPIPKEKRALALMREGRQEEAQRVLETEVLKLHPVRTPRASEYSASVSMTTIARHLEVKAGAYVEARLTVDPETGQPIAVLRRASPEWFQGGASKVVQGRSLGIKQQSPRSRQ